MIQLKKYFLFFLVAILAGCSSIPKNTVNACVIFDEKYFWYKFAKSSEKKWGAPVELQMAIIKKESGFDWLARPERTKLFKVIPWKRPSSSLGYSQAVEDTWELYKRRTGKKYATRILFKDSSDFIGWYIDQTSKKMKVAKNNYFKQYLYYYNGWSDKTRPESILYAKEVSKTAKKYRAQIKQCNAQLKKNKYIIF
ncbi:MAG: lytic transglycosylase [Pelagibacteraceae bacterium]|nr:lytic transglycosylase [Pelagibacteraceae bacterium]